MRGNILEREGEIVHIEYEKDDKKFLCRSAVCGENACSSFVLGFRLGLMV